MKIKKYIYKFLVKNMFEDFFKEDINLNTSSLEKGNQSTIERLINQHEYIEYFNDTSKIYSSAKSDSTNFGDWNYFYKKTSNLFKIVKNKEIKAEYYPNGNLKMKKINSETVEFYYFNGEIEKILITPKNELKIIYIYKFYKNGQLKESYRTINGRMIGLYNSFREDGIPIKEAFFNRYGEEEGTTITYYDNGIIESNSDFYKGYKQGYEKRYYPYGLLKKIDVYFKNNYVQTLINYSDDGKERK